MAEDRKNLAEDNADRWREGENPQVGTEAEDDTQTVDAGVPGQIQYPDRAVYAERAAAFAAGKEDTLYPEEDEPEDSGRQVRATDTGDREPGDETGEETEPAAMRGMGADPNEANDGANQEERNR